MKFQAFLLEYFSNLFTSQFARNTSTEIQEFLIEGFVVH